MIIVLAEATIINDVEREKGEVVSVPDNFPPEKIKRIIKC